MHGAAQRCATVLTLAVFLCGFSVSAQSASPSPGRGSFYNPPIGESGWGTGLWNTPSPTPPPSPGQQTPSPTPAPTPTATPAATHSPQQTPVPAVQTPAATPATAPAKTASPSPSPTPAATPAATPAQTPARTPAATPKPTQATAAQEGSNAPAPAPATHTPETGNGPAMGPGPAMAPGAGSSASPPDSFYSSGSSGSGGSSANTAGGSSGGSTGGGSGGDAASSGNAPPAGVDSSLTAISATMSLTGTNLWPFTSDKQTALINAMYATMPVTPIDIRVTNSQLEPNSRRRRNLLQSSYTPAPSPSASSAPAPGPSSSNSNGNSSSTSSGGGGFGPDLSGGNYQTVLVTAQYDPGTAALLGYVVGNLSNTIMAGTNLSDACNARGLNVTTIALLGTVPIVPVDVQLPHKVGYILGPILAVLFIVAFFGAMSYLAWEKRRDISKAQDVENPNAKGNAKPSRLGALVGCLTCAACRGGLSGGKAAQPSLRATTPAAGATPVKQQEMMPAGAAAGVSPARDPRNLSPLNLFKGGRRNTSTAQPEAQNGFMTHNPMYGSTTPATPGSAASEARSPVTDFFKRSGSQVASAVGRMSGQRTPKAGEGAAAAGGAAQVETPRGAATPRTPGAGGSGEGRLAAPQLPRLTVPQRSTSRQRGEGATPQDSARKAPPNRGANRTPHSPESPGVLYVT